MATYIIQAGPSGPVKIGKADDVEGRIAALQVGHPEELRLIRLVDTDFDAEPSFHDRFAHLRIRGEWFRFDAEMMTFVPSAPPDEAPIADVIRFAKRRAIEEAANLLADIWQHFRGIETKGQFTKRVARMLQIKERRVRGLMYADERRVDVHEIEGLRAIARKLNREVTRASQSSAVPLFDRLEGGR